MKILTLPVTGLLCALTAGTSFADNQPLTQWEAYSPDQASELKVAQDAADELISQFKTDYTGKGKRVFRDAHPRGIGCMAATFTVDPNLDQKYQTGIFANAGKTYEAIVRVSSSLGPVGDQKPDARGFAIKIFGVPGTKLLDDQPNATTQDFIHINGPTFPAKDTSDFAGIVHVKTNPANLPAFLLAKGKVFLHLKELFSLVASSAGNPDNGKSLAETQFFSMVPYLLKGRQVNTPIKFSTRPCTDVVHRPLNGSDSELRDDLQERLNEGGLCYDFLVQFYTPAHGDEIENGMSNWGTDRGQFTKFATINIPSQTFKTDQKLHYCDNLSYQPWHTTAQMQPLGNINRARKIVYEAISKSRHGTNNEMSHYIEPTDASAFKNLTDPTYTVWDAVTIPADAPSNLPQ